MGGARRRRAACVPLRPGGSRGAGRAAGARSRGPGGALLLALPLASPRGGPGLRLLRCGPGLEAGPAGGPGGSGGPQSQGWAGRATGAPRGVS